MTRPLGAAERDIHPMMNWHEFDGVDGKIAIDMRRTTGVIALADERTTIVTEDDSYNVNATFRAVMTILRNVLERENID